MTTAPVRIQLSRAQRKFLEDLELRRDIFQPGFDVDVLTGSETAMAGRLAAQGLVEKRHETRRARGRYWDITDAGRAAIGAQP